VLHEDGVFGADGIELRTGGETFFLHQRVVEAVGQDPFPGGRLRGAFAQPGEAVLKRAAGADGRGVEVFPVQHRRREQDMPVRVVKAGHDGFPFHVAADCVRADEGGEVFEGAHGENAIPVERDGRGHGIVSIQRQDDGVEQQLAGIRHRRTPWRIIRLVRDT